MAIFAVQLSRGVGCVKARSWLIAFSRTCFWTKTTKDELKNMWTVMLLESKVWNNFLSKYLAAFVNYCLFFFFWLFLGIGYLTANPLLRLLSIKNICKMKSTLIKIMSDGDPQMLKSVESSESRWIFKETEFQLSRDLTKYCSFISFYKRIVDNHP